MGSGKGGLPQSVLRGERTVELAESSFTSVTAVHARNFTFTSNFYGQLH